MKKYFIGMLALVLAIGFSAFTKPHKQTKNGSTVYTFVMSQDPLSSGIVSTLGNWTFESSPGSCPSGTQNKACRIEVLDQFTHVEGTDIVLNSQEYVEGTQTEADDEDYVQIAATSGGTVQSVERFKVNLGSSLNLDDAFNTPQPIQ